MTVNGSEKISQFAEASLRNIILSGTTNTVASGNASAPTYISSMLASIIKLPNVHSVSSHQAATALQLIGIFPRT